MSETHIIGRQRFRIKIDAKDDADLLFSQLSDLNKKRLTQLMEELMSELAPPGQTIRIDKLTLKLGSLPENNFADEVAARVISELRGKLREIIVAATADKPEVASENNAYELLEYYLRKGYWPWWATKEKRLSPTGLLLSVLDQHPERLPELLSAVMDVRVLHRLRLQFSEVALTKVNAQLMGQGWPTLQKDISLLAVLYDKAPFRSPKTLSRPRATFLAIALKLILTRRTTTLSTGKSLGILIDELANLQQVPAASLRRHFLDTLLSFEEEQPSQWPPEQLKRVKLQLAVVLPSPEPTSSTEEPLQVIIAYLTDGTTPATGPLTTASAIERLLTKWLGKKEETLLAAIRQSLTVHAINERVHKTLSWPTLRALHKWAWASTWAEIKAYLADVESLLNQVNVTPATADQLRRSLLADWLSQRFKTAAPPRPSARTKLVQAGIWSTLQSLERETKRPLPEILAGTKILGPAASEKWQSDLPKLITAILKDGQPEPSVRETKPERLRVLFAYLTNGATPATGPLRTAGAIEGLLTKWLRKNEKLLLQILPKLLSSKTNNKRLHKTLRWPTLLALHQWAWASFWPEVAVYLADVEKLSVQVGVTPFTADYLRRSLLADWLSFRFGSAKPSGAAQAEFVRKLWEVGVRSTLHRLERETNRPLRELLAAADLLGPSYGTKWQSDLPATISAILEEDRTEKFSNAVPAKAIGVYRFFLERGYLPEGHAKNGLPRLEEDIYQKVITGNPALFSMLATVLRDEQAFTRFRRETSLKLLYALAFQLVRDSVTDLAGLAKESLPFRPPVTGRPLADQPGSKDETEAAGSSAPEQAEAALGAGSARTPEGEEDASPAAVPPLHPRPRPPKEALENDQDLSAREILFAYLEALYPATGWWKKDRSNFLRYSYAFLVRQRLLAGKGTITLAALTGAWAQALQRAAGAPWPVVARNLQAAAKDNKMHYPATLKAALGTVARLSPTDPAPTETDNPNSPSPTSDSNQEGQDPNSSTPQKAPPDSLAVKWADYLTTKKKTPPTPSPLTAADFKKLGAADPQYRSQLVIRLHGQRINPERLLKLLPSAAILEFTDRLAAEISGGSPPWLPALRQLLHKEAVYPKKTEATQQVNRYALLLLLGSEAVMPRQADRFTEQLLALIARELKVATPVLAGRLLTQAETVAVPANLSIVLQRVHASVRAEKIKEIQQATDQQAQEASKLSPPARDGLFQQAALAYFLENGESPWWEEASLTIDQLFIQAVSSDVKQLTKLLAQRPELAERLFPFLTAEDLQTFISGAFPDYADFLLVWTETLQRLYEKRLLAAAGGPTTAWYPAWAYALRRQAFGSEAFVRAALKTTSEVFSIREDKLRTLIREEVASNVALNDVRYYRIAAILRSLPDEESPAKAAGPKGPADREEPAKKPDAPSLTYGEMLADEVRALRHFLFYGTPEAGRTSLSRATLLQIQERLLLLHPEVAAPLYRAVLGDRIARERWVRYFGDALANGLGKLLLGKKLKWVKRLWQDLQLLLPGLVPRFNEAEFWQWASIHLLAYPPVLQQRPDLRHYPEHLLASLAKKNGITFQQLFKDIVALLEKPPAGQQEDWEQLLAQVKAEKTRQAAEDPAESASEKDHPMEESLYIHNAGLVIMAPFLTRYFSMLEMLEDRVFKDEEAAIRGVLLLEYLASGRTEVPEHELVFNKVLCGLDVATPVPGAIELSEEEEEVSRQLLNATLQNWDKMSNSTVDNLRGSFILRPGLLQEHETNWSLKVESAGYDILLTFLPWTISVISLPWVEKRLEIDWKSNN